MIAAKGKEQTISGKFTLFYENKYVIHKWNSVFIFSLCVLIWKCNYLSTLSLSPSILNHNFFLWHSVFFFCSFAPLNASRENSFNSKPIRQNTNNGLYSSEIAIITIQYTIHLPFALVLRAYWISFRFYFQCLSVITIVKWLRLQLHSPHTIGTHVIEIIVKKYICHWYMKQINKQTKYMKRNFSIG